MSGEDAELENWLISVIEERQGTQTVLESRILAPIEGISELCITTDTTYLTQKIKLNELDLFELFIGPDSSTQLGIDAREVVEGVDLKLSKEK